MALNFTTKSKLFVTRVRFSETTKDRNLGQARAQECRSKVPGKRSQIELRSLGKQGQTEVRSQEARAQGFRSWVKGKLSQTEHRSLGGKVKGKLGHREARS